MGVGMFEVNVLKIRRLPPLLLVVLMMAIGAATAAPSASIVVDAGSGRVLSQENALQRWYPASLTKIMTAYVTFRAIQDGEVTLTSPIVMTKHAASEPPSKMGYKVGSVMTLDNALKMMLVKSANDVAMAIAESIGGSQAAFAARMNKEARRLGMTGSNFVNPNGLHSPSHYSTARDIAIVSAAVRREFPQYAHYFKLEGIRAGDKLLRSYNILLGRFDGADGMKTGFVCASGFNLVASATRNGRTLIAVVLGSPSQQDRAEKAALLLTEGFAKGRFTGPKIATLDAYGDGLDRAPNLRSEICTKKAQMERWDDRDEKGRMIIRSHYLKPISRELHVVRVGLGGATGPTPEVWGNVPIPTPRPLRTVDGEIIDLKPGEATETVSEIPIPTPRESVLR